MTSPVPAFNRMLQHKSNHRAVEVMMDVSMSARIAGSQLSSSLKLDTSTQDREGSASFKQGQRL